MLSATANVAKFAKTAKICWNLSEETLKYHQESRFWFFLKIKIWTCRRGTRACFHSLDFQSKNFPHAIFIVQKRPLYVNFSIPLYAKWHFFQGSISLMDMRFYWHVPNSPRNKNLKSLNPYLLYKMVFLASKTLLYPLSTRERTFFSNFEPYDLANGMEWISKIWWTYISKQVSYKILQLKVQKKASILLNLPCFQEGLFWGSFGLNVAIDV